MPQHPAIAQGKVAIVTGAASGIGLAAAERFAAHGMKLALADTDQAALEAVADRLGQSVEVLSSVCDVGDRKAVEALADQVYERFGEVAILMNNAGREGGGGLLGEAARWHEILGTNLWGVINGVQVFAPRMIAQGNARRHHQHRLEAGHHLPAGRYRLQCLEGGREGRERGAGARASWHRWMRDHGALC